MPYIRVLEIATFYTMFNLAPVGKFHVQMCGTTPCLLAGSDGIKNILLKRIGGQGEVTADGLFSWVEVECLGRVLQCPDGPDQRRLLRGSRRRRISRNCSTIWPLGAR